MRIFTVILGLLLTAPLIHAQEPAKPAKAGASQHPAVSAEEAQAMREDLQRMKSLVYQMERNLASITTAQDPLKHQFQLEVEMWQLQIASMERRLNSSAERK
jgi:hypothetical protein